MESLSVGNVFLLLGGVFAYKLFSVLVELWLKKTNQEYVTRAECERKSACGNLSQDYALRKLMYQVNQLKQVMFRIGLKVGLDEDELNVLVSMNGDSDEKIKR